jgi:hypothetical protein
MPAATLDRRLAVLEQRLRPPPPRRVVFIVGMARPGQVWVADSFSMPGGTRVDRAEAEHPDVFQARVQVAALAGSTSPVVVVQAVEGREVPEALVERWRDVATKETDQ